MSNSLPKFDFSGMSLTDADFNQQLEENQKSESKFFRPGRHEVSIIGSEYKGQSESDPTWSKIVVKFEGTGGKTITDMLLIPTRTLVFRTRKGEDSVFPASKLKDFLEAVGAEFTVERLGELCKTYFGTENALVGLNLVVDTAYTGNYVKYQGKNEAGQLLLQITTRDGETLDSSLYFNDYKAANEYAEKNKIAVKNFVDVTSYSKSSTPNKAKGLGGSW